jgi:hypothetical protein
VHAECQATVSVSRSLIEALIEYAAATDGDAAERGVTALDAALGEARQVLGAPGDGPSGASRMAGAESRMSAAVNAGTDFVQEELDLRDRDIDLTNVVANAIATAWHCRGQGFTWAEFIAACWSAEPGSEEDPASWWDW